MTGLFPNQKTISKQSTKKSMISSELRDSYVHGSDNTSCVYSANGGLKRGGASFSVLDMINFNYLDIMKQKCDKQFSFIIGGNRKITYSQNM